VFIVLPFLIYILVQELPLSSGGAGAREYKKIPLCLPSIKGYVNFKHKNTVLDHKKNVGTGRDLSVLVQDTGRKVSPKHEKYNKNSRIYNIYIVI
jgi:hypothetical protein